MIHFYHLEKFGLMREAIGVFSAKETDLVSEGHSASAADLDQLLTHKRIDVLLLDMELETERYQPLTDCYELCSRLHTEYPNIQVVLHSPYRHAGWIHKFMELGIRGFVSKHSGFSEVVTAMRTVQAGKIFICPIIASQFSNYHSFMSNNKVKLKSIYPGFSPREVEVLDLIAQGMSSREIASTLFLSLKTVETHRKNLIDKAQVKNTAELINFVSTRGILQL